MATYTLKARTHRLWQSRHNAPSHVYQSVKYDKSKFLPMCRIWWTDQDRSNLLISTNFCKSDPWNQCCCGFRCGCAAWLSNNTTHTYTRQSHSSGVCHGWQTELCSHSPWNLSKHSRCVLALGIMYQVVCVRACASQSLLMMSLSMRLRSPFFCWASPPFTLSNTFVRWGIL